MKPIFIVTIREVLETHPDEVDVEVFKNEADAIAWINKQISEKIDLYDLKDGSVEGWHVEIGGLSHTIQYDLKKCLNALEYYEFVSKLIGDFKFQNADEVYSVFDKLYIEYENVICVFKAKYKKYKEESKAKKMDLKLVYNYLKAQ